MAVLAVLAVVGAAWAGQDKTSDEPQKITLALDLDDGSHVIGVPGIESIPVQTSYAKMGIQLKEILTIRIAEDHEKASVDLRNGDKLKGVITLEPIKLETIFGKVSIKIEHIKEIRVVLSGGALNHGLVLHYSFDKDEGGKVVDESGMGNDGYWVGVPMYEAGIKGQAARFRSKDTYIVSSSHRLNMNGWREATVSVWVSLNDYTSYGHIINRGTISTYEPGTFELAVGRLYGSGLLAVRSSATGSAADYMSRDAANLSLHRWYHLVMTYDGAMLRYYIDGQIDKEVPVKDRNVPLWDGPDTKLVIGSISRLPFINWTDMFFNGLIDEVSIFDRALSDSEVKQIYNAQR